MRDEENGGQDSALPIEDRAARTLAEKFKIAPDLAKRLIDLHRAAVERETKRPRMTGPRRIS
jgi:hypothetical protein